VSVWSTTSSIRDIFPPIGLRHRRSADHSHAVGNAADNDPERVPVAYPKDLPQQEPGPAQPAWPGWLPQQPVSFGPGKSAPVRPVSELVADMILAVSVEPQLGQVKGASLAVTITSPVLPQAWHWMS
jgi:hypothetical protein